MTPSRGCRSRRARRGQNGGHGAVERRGAGAGVPRREGVDRSRQLPADAERAATGLQPDEQPPPDRRLRGPRRRGGAAVVEVDRPGPLRAPVPRWPDLAVPARGRRALAPRAQRAGRAGRARAPRGADGERDQVARRAPARARRRHGRGGARHARRPQPRGVRRAAGAPAGRARAALGPPALGRRRRGLAERAAGRRRHRRRAPTRRRHRRDELAAEVERLRRRLDRLEELLGVEPLEPPEARPAVLDPGGEQTPW